MTDQPASVSFFVACFLALNASKSLFCSSIPPDQLSTAGPLRCRSGLCSPASEFIMNFPFFLFSSVGLKPGLLVWLDTSRYLGFQNQY